MFTNFLLTFLFGKIRQETLMIHTNLSVGILRTPFNFMTSCLQSSTTLQGGHRDTCFFLWHNSLFIDVSRSHTIRHKHAVRLLSTSDQLVAEATTYTTHNKHKIRISISLAEFEQVIAAIKRAQTCALDRTATGIGKHTL